MEMFFEILEESNYLHVPFFYLLRLCIGQSLKQCRLLLVRLNLGFLDSRAVCIEAETHTLVARCWFSAKVTKPGAEEVDLDIV